MTRPRNTLDLSKEVTLHSFVLDTRLLAAILYILEIVRPHKLPNYFFCDISTDVLCVVTCVLLLPFLYGFEKPNILHLLILIRRMLIDVKDEITFWFD